MNPAKNRLDKWIEAFLMSAGTLLAGGALIRFMVASGDSQILGVSDSLSGIPVREAVMIVGVAELVVGLICLFGKSIGLRTVSLTLLMTVWAISRAHLAHIGVNLRETCFGLLTNPLRISNALMERMLELLPFCLLIGSYVAVTVVGVFYRQYFSVVRRSIGTDVQFINRGILFYIDLGILVFVSVTGLFLLAAALVQFMVAAGDSRLLTLPDAVLGIQLRYAVMFVGVIELVVGLICLFGKAMSTGVTLLAWLLTNWAAYQAGLIYLGANGRYSCLGLFTDPLRLAGGYWNRLGNCLPVVLLIGAYVAVFLAWASQRKQGRQGYIKVACLGCGGHIEFPADTISWKIACPHCGGGVRLQNLPKIA